MLSVKDIIGINERLDRGIVVNRGSLEYAASITARSKNWLRNAAVLTRAILIDHVFEDGNKRTAAATIMVCMEMGGAPYNVDRVNRAVITILKKNITDVRVIERVIKNAID